MYARASGRAKWSLDHVIPKSAIPLGSRYGDSLRNLLPVLTRGQQFIPGDGRRHQDQLQGSMVRQVSGSR